jgi:hypothetical protein
MNESILVNLRCVPKAPVERMSAVTQTLADAAPIGASRNASQNRRRSSSSLVGTPEISHLEVGMAPAAALRTVDDLRRYVHQTLCQHENLVVDQFVLHETPLARGGEPCGLQFVLRGPRNVRLGAVWAKEPNQLYFYDARGGRFRKEQLKERLTTDVALPACPRDL